MLVSDLTPAQQASRKEWVDGVFSQLKDFKVQHQARMDNINEMLADAERRVAALEATRNR